MARRSRIKNSGKYSLRKLAAGNIWAWAASRVQGSVALAFALDSIVNLFRVIFDSSPQVRVTKIPLQPAVYPHYHYEFPISLHPRESNNLERNVMLNYLDLLPNDFLQLQIDRFCWESLSSGVILWAFFLADCSFPQEAGQPLFIFPSCNYCTSAPLPPSLPPLLTNSFHCFLIHWFCFYSVWYLTPSTFFTQYAHHQHGTFATF